MKTYIKTPQQIVEDLRKYYELEVTLTEAYYLLTKEPYELSIMLTVEEWHDPLDAFEALIEDLPQDEVSEAELLKAVEFDVVHYNNVDEGANF